MLKIIVERIRQGHRTGKYPAQPPMLPPLFRGLPTIVDEACDDCGACIAACPYGAIEKQGDRLHLDMGKCIFCGDCQAACPSGALTLGKDHRLAAAKREDLVVDSTYRSAACALNQQMRKLFGRSLKLRQVSAGGCNACEADLNVLGTLVFDLARFGIQFTASPRHADGLMVTGPVTKNMQSALQDTFSALSEPRIVIASGACAIGGGPFRNSPEAHNGIGDLIPVDLYIPGCPPHPYTALDGLLSLLGRIERNER